MAPNGASLALHHKGDGRDSDDCTGQSWGWKLLPVGMRAVAELDHWPRRGL